MEEGRGQQGTAGGMQPGELGESSCERRENGQEAAARAPRCSWFCRAQLCSANVPSPHTAWGVLVCNSVNNECEIFIVFTADPCEIISGWVISQTMRARAVCCS